ncbi:hypothetical protein QGN29_00495 [Temperatibacter marinus]|uniref:Uncharacterized protein n=1 Tax=Temperatibacter marinus TaxID=1456591 RepID=A0AA52EHY2_9PROT|nr:hypothetical protein [Temperatibacter marinus]WND02839.1 hypothetical protein QGN29_00495 [Temperatibacter marinus]
MNNQTQNIKDLSSKKGFTFFELMESAGQMKPLPKDEFDADVQAFFSKIKISRPANLGGAVAAA